MTARPAVVTVSDVAERIRAHAAHPGWSCLLRRAHVTAWVEALYGLREEPWPLATPPAVRERLELAWRRRSRTGGIRLSPAELRQALDTEAAP